MSAVISIWQDPRREKYKGVYPVKLRVWFNGQQKLYPTKTDLTKEEFQKSYLADKPRGNNRDIQTKLNAILSKANAIAKDLSPFSFEKFEKRMYRTASDSNNVFYYYNEIIKELDEAEKVNTSKSYSYSKQSIKDFLQAKGRKQDFLALEDISVAFLNDYERWMISKGKTKTTIGIYLRPLRAVFNHVISEENFPKELYPFGKKRFKIPAGSKVKKALTKDDIKALIDYKVSEDSHMAKARDLWLFTFQCNGMNVRDMCDLKVENYNGNTIVFYRHKTIDTTKESQKPIIVIVTEGVRKLVNKYGDLTGFNGSYIFPFFRSCKTEKDRVRELGKITKYINQHLKRLARLAGISTEVSCNWARHSFSTIAINNGASLEFIQDSLGHKNISTTMNYWNGFEDSTKREIANKLMDFI